MSTGCTPENMGHVSFPKASPNTELIHSLPNVSLQSSHCPKSFQRTEKQIKYTNLSQTDKNQTKEEPATVVIEELLLPPYSHLPPACWEYGKPLEKKCRVTNHTKDSYFSCMVFNFQPDLCVGRKHISLKTYQLTNRNWQVKYCLRTITNSISH